MIFNVFFKNLTKNIKALNIRIQNKIKMKQEKIYSIYFYSYHM